MTRRKGERRVAVPLTTWTESHPVAQSIREGDSWFGAWQRQMCTPYSRLAKLTGIPAARLVAIDAGGAISRAELDALARAWSISSSGLQASMPSPDLVVD